MKCAKVQLLLTRYIDQDVTMEERIEVETHLLHCPACKELADIMNQETAVLHHVLTTPPLPDHFTIDILGKLEPFPNPKAATVVQSMTRSARRKNATRLIGKRAAVVSAALLVTLATGSFVSPTFAEYISSFITRIGGEWGVKLAAEQGFSTAVNKKVTSNGYTLWVKDIVADPTRLVATFTIEDDKGEILPDLFIPHYGNNQLYITDTDGNRLSKVNAFQRGDDFADFVFDLNDPPDQLVVHFQIKEFGSTEPKSVDWNLSAQVDLSASKKVTQDLPIEEIYVSPQGISFHLKNILYAPSASRFSIETVLTEKAKSQYIEQAKQIEGIQMDEDTLSRYGATYFTYHLENEKGEQVASSRNGRYNPEDDGHIYHTPAKADPGKEGWHGSFVPMQSAEQVYFVLDSLEILEPARFDIEFEPAELAKNPVTKKHQGDTYSVVRMEKQMDPQTNEPVTAIRLEGTSSISEFNRWALLDASGKEYEVEIDYTNSEFVDQRFTQTLLVKDVPEPSSKLKLVMKTIRNKYTDVKWRVPLPQPK